LLGASVFALLAATAILVTAGRAMRVYNNPPAAAPAPAPTPDSYPMSRNQWRAEVEAELERMKLAIAEGIERVDRAEKRIRKSVTGARKLVRENGLEHSGLEAEYDELRLDDGEPSQAVELPPLPASVEPGRRIRFPGVSQAFLERMGSS